MKRLNSLLLLALLVAASISTNAKDMADWVVRMTLCQVIDDSTTEEIVDFSRNDDGSWTLANFTPTPMMEMKIHVYFNQGGLYIWDEWHGGPDGGEPFAITPDMLGNQIQGSNPGQTFYFKHNGTFTINLTKFDIDYNSFTVTGSFSPAYYLTGQFNQWGETPFTLVDGEYKLSQTLYGEFLVKDHNDELYGAVTSDDRYTITEASPSVTLSAESDGGKKLYLADESDYTFTLNLTNGVLSVGDWPPESIIGVIHGATTEVGDGNVIEFPMNWDWVSGKYVSNQVAIPEGYRCKVIKRSSLTSVEDRWFGADGDFPVYVTGTQDITLAERNDQDIIFEGDGTFQFSVDPDFTSLHIEGGYNYHESYYLLGDFNDWSMDNKVPFTRDGEVYTASLTMDREFLIVDSNGKYYGGATTGSHYQLDENFPSVTLADDEQVMKHLYIGNEANYTFTIENGVLTVSGWTGEVITCKLEGTIGDQPESEELDVEMTIDNDTGSYVSRVVSIPAGYCFQVLKHSSMTTVPDEKFGVDENDFYVTEDKLGIPITINSNSSDIHFDKSGVFDFVVAPDFSSITVTGRFEEGPDEAYYLIGDFNDWDENSMVQFDENDGEFALEKYFGGEFLIVDQQGVTYGAEIAGDCFTFSENANNEVLSSAEGKKHFNLSMPAPYTVTISGRMIFINGFINHGYYLCGDFNEWQPELMTDNGDGTFSISKTVEGNDSFKFRDQDGYWYGMETESNSDGLYTDEPVIKGEDNPDFCVRKDGTFEFSLREDHDAGTLLLTVSEVNTPVSLAELLQGENGIIDEELTVAYIKDDKVYVTNGADWLRIDGATNASDLNLGDVIQANTVFGDFTGLGTVPVVIINEDLQIRTNSGAPTFTTIELGGEFDMPTPNQVVNLIGYYYEGGALYADEFFTGQSIALVDAEELINHTKYKLTAAIEYLESAGHSRMRLRGGPDLSKTQARMLGPAVEPTGAQIIGVGAEVLSVKYISVTGQMGSQPFEGINLVVTTLSDGTTKTEKMVK